MEIKIRRAMSLLQEVLGVFTDPDDRQTILNVAATHPGNLIPAAVLYAQLPFTRTKAAPLLMELGFVRVKKETGIFWVKPT